VLVIYLRAMKRSCIAQPPPCSRYRFR